VVFGRIKALKMSVIQSCHDTKDVLDLFKPQGLYLKPIARLNVSVQLPQLKKSGSKISNWEVMEEVKKMARPLTFPVFKIAKSSPDFIRFEAEAENYGLMDTAMAKLDLKTIKLSGFEEQLKVRAAEAKPPFPTRHDWDSFFKDNKNMNEMKAGERPDTIHIENLPTKWFRNTYDRSGAAKDKPDEHVLKKVFQTFGEIRKVDIPCRDPYRAQMKSSIAGVSTFSFFGSGQDLVFDAYIQYKEYIGFVKAMNSLKGMKLCCKDRHEDRSWVANIKVDFDKTKHLADSTIKKRQQEREKLIEKEREKEESERRSKELAELKRQDELRKMEAKERDEILRKEAEREEKMRRRMEREERRRERKKKKRNLNEDEDHDRRIAEEERKLLVAQRKLESIRLLDELLERVKVAQNIKGDVKNSEKDLFKTAKLASKLSKKSDITGLIEKDRDEAELRNKLVSKLKEKEIEKMKECGEKLRDNSFYSDGEDESREEISEEELGKEERILSSEEEEELDEVSEEDLRLTSSTDNDEEGNGTEDKKKKRKKEKKKKKKKEKEKDEKREKRKRRKELEDYTTLAQRIANRDRRSRSPRDKDKERHHSRRERSPARKPHEHWDRPRERTREDEIRERQLERMQKVRESQLRSRMEAKRKEQAMDEVYDQMVNGGGGYRKLKRGEHYEDVQNQVLANEIRIKERREKYEREQRRGGGGYRGGGDPRDRGYQRQAHHHGQYRGGREDRQYHPYRR